MCDSRTECETNALHEVFEGDRGRWLGTGQTWRRGGVGLLPVAEYSYESGKRVVRVDLVSLSIDSSEELSLLGPSLDRL